VFTPIHIRATLLDHPIMSGNPNMQKIGKRKTAAGQKQPDWLFPDNGKPTSASKSQNEKGLKNKDKQLAKDLLKRRATGEPPKSAPAVQLLTLVEAFLSEYEFTGTRQALKTEIASRGETIEKIAGVPSLGKIYNEWNELKGGILADKHVVQKQEKVVKKKKGKNAETSSSSSDSSSESDSEDTDVEMTDAPLAKKSSPKRSPSPFFSASSSSSDSADDEKEAVIVKAVSPKPKATLKRKAPSSSSSSGSSSDSSSDSSSEDEAPKAKKLKPAQSSSSDSSSSDSSSDPDTDSSTNDKATKAENGKALSSSSDSGSSSDSDSTSEDEALKAKKSKKAASSLESGSSDSDSDSDSDSSTNSVAAKVPLPDSDSESSSESDSDSEGAEKKPPVSSDTSATLSDGPKKASLDSDSSSDSSSSDSEADTKPAKVARITTTARQLSPPLPPNPAAKLPKKKVNEPFSRIPKDVKVDPRLASNAFVPYDYAQKAHQDLIVTKGKGFTKEKNKKKRGSYKGGYIDVEGKKGIKFED
jgi:hypothetical protein